MKKFVLSCIACLMLLVGMLTFSACKDKNYDLSNLNTDYKHVIDTHDYIEQNDKLVVNFHSNALTERMNNTSQRYKYLKDYYNILFTNNISFANKYVDIVGKASNNNLVPASKRNELKNNLDGFDASLVRFDTNVKYLVDWLNLPDPDDSVPAQNFLINLFKSYEDVFEAQSKLSESVADIYFNYIRADAFTRESYEKDSLDNLIRTKLAVHVDYQKFNLTDIYINMNILGTSMAEDLVKSSSSSLDSMFTGWYQPSISSISKDVSTVNAGRADSFKENMITVYELNTQVSNLNYSYIVAKNNIEYQAKKVDYNATAVEKKYCYTMEAYEAISIQFNDALSACFADLS